MGNAFNAEDEEGEVFDNTYLGKSRDIHQVNPIPTLKSTDRDEFTLLADMKNGHCSLRLEPDRVSILQQRNALCKPHLKSSYPAEMQFHPLSLTEEEIKVSKICKTLYIHIQLECFAFILLIHEILNSIIVRLSTRRRIQ